MNKEQIQKLTDQEDIPSLCTLVNEALHGIAEDRELLADSISQILEIWMMDFDTHKGGDPNDYPFLDGVKALETLNQSEELIYRACYLTQCADYLFRNRDFSQAREKALVAETFLQESMKNHPHDQTFGRYLIDLYQNFPSNDFQERELKMIQAIDLSTKALPLSRHYLSMQLGLFYQKNEFPSLEPRLIQERQIWLKKALLAAEQDPQFALELSNRCLSVLDDFAPEDSLYAQIKQILSLLAELALKGLPKSFQTDPISFAHTFMLLGKSLQKDSFFEAAQNLYAGHSSRVAADRNKPFRHIMTYEINAKEERAKLLEKNGHPKEAEEFRQQNIDSYLLEWRDYQNDISYLSHAMEYLLNRIFSLPPEKRTQKLFEEIRDISLAAEKIGEGIYWFPYVGLFWSYTFLGKNDDAKLWLGRGYLTLTILIEGPLKKLFGQAQKLAPQEMVEFIDRLLKHFDKIPDKTFWPGPPPRQEILQMSLADLLKKI